MTTIAEDLLLLGTDEEGRTLLGAGFFRGFVLAGGMLTELVRLERLALDDRRRLSVVDTRSTADELLDQTLARFAEVAGRRAKNTLFGVGRHLLELLRERLARAEALVPEQGRSLGVPLPTRWRTLPDGPRRRLQEELAAVMTGRAVPDARTGPLGPCSPRRARCTSRRPGPPAGDERSRREAVRPGARGGPVRGRGRGEGDTGRPGGRGRLSWTRASSSPCEGAQDLTTVRRGGHPGAHTVAA